MNFSEWQQIANSAQLDVVTDVAPINNTDTHDNWQLRTSKGLFFVRTALKRDAAKLTSEVDSLKAISEAQTRLACATTIAQGNTSKTAWLVQQWETLTQKTDERSTEELALALATLHQRTSPSGHYGWHQTNFIGSTLQHNHWSDDWISFYRSQRLLPQVRIAQKQGLPTQLVNRIDQLLESLAGLFLGYQPEACLIHGNLRHQHQYLNVNGEAYITQPACCYADREMDLAALSLNYPLNERLYEFYDAHLPRQANYQQRLSLYQLYYTLIDFNQHGSTHIAKLKALLEQIESFEGFLFNR